MFKKSKTTLLSIINGQREFLLKCAGHLLIVIKSHTQTNNTYKIDKPLIQLTVYRMHLLLIFYCSCSDAVVKELYGSSLKIDTEEDTKNLSRQLYNLLTEISIKIL